jgi:Raf kinase inhibitor-like YbhB/YbcL family protein
VSTSLIRLLTAIKYQVKLIYKVSLKFLEVVTMNKFLICFFVIIFLMVGGIFTPVGAENQFNIKEKGGKIMEIKSASFNHEDMIPSKYTCDGQNISPPLSWSGTPEKTKSFALICDDPDAPVGLWVHWVIFDIPANVNSLPEKVSRQEEVAGLGKNGKNTSGNWGYDGPCPPGGTHRYYFKLYALDTMLNKEPGLTKDDLLKAMKGHILAEAELMGRYSRKR